jgi:hypothetical protein
VDDPAKWSSAEADCRCKPQEDAEEPSDETTPGPDEEEEDPNTMDGIWTGYDWSDA